MNNYLPIICSLRDLSADKLLVTSIVFSGMGSSLVAVKDPAGWVSTGVGAWLRRSSSMWSGAGGDISWYTIATGGGGTGIEALYTPEI